MCQFQPKNILRTVVLCVCALCLSSPPAWAEQGDEGGSDKEMRIPVLNEGETLMEGRVDRVEEPRIVINDSLYLLMPETELYTSYMGPLSLDFFPPGKEVVFIVNKHKEILKMWLVE